MCKDKFITMLLIFLVILCGFAFWLDCIDNKIKTEAIAEMVKSGHSPIEASCAVDWKAFKCEGVTK